MMAAAQFLHARYAVGGSDVRGSKAQELNWSHVLVG